MFAALYLPDFELQAALRHQPELHRQPVALLDDTETKATIMQLTQSAAEAGVWVSVGSIDAGGRRGVLCLLVSLIPTPSVEAGKP